MPVSQLVGQLLFRVETRAPRQEVRRLAGRIELPVDSRWGSDRPGYRRPQRRGRAERPIHSAAGLDLEAGVVVVLDLGAEGQVQPVGNQGDLVLDESSEPLSRNTGRQ